MIKGLLIWTHTIVSVISTIVLVGIISTDHSIDSLLGALLVYLYIIWVLIVLLKYDKIKN
jgi:Ca2+/Na+ antiporter